MRAGELSGGRDAADRAAVEVGRRCPRLADAAPEERVITPRVLRVRREALAVDGDGGAAERGTTRRVDSDDLGGRQEDEGQRLVGVRVRVRGQGQGKG